MKQGIFISLEGPEGAGKSTQREYISEYFKARGHTVCLTREPGGTPLAERIREILLKPDDEVMCNDTELLMMFAARAQHIDQVIKPFMAKGSVVICDRFVDSSYAYQHYGRGMPIEGLEILEKFVLKDFKPDLTLLFDLDVKQGMKRASARGKLDRFEQESMDFFEKVRQGFLSRYHKGSWDYAYIDAGQSIDHVQRQIDKKLFAKFGI